MLDTPTRLSSVHPRLVRTDALPEHTNYQVSGCSIHDNCLTCPLIRCRYDEPNGLRSASFRERNREILEMYRDDAKIEDIAKHAGLNRRSVFRVLQNLRRSGELKEEPYTRA